MVWLYPRETIIGPADAPFGEGSNGNRPRKEGVPYIAGGVLAPVGVLMGYTESEPEGQARVVALR